MYRVSGGWPGTLDRLRCDAGDDDGEDDDDEHGDEDGDGGVPTTMTVVVTRLPLFREHR